MKNFYVYVLVAVLTCFQGQAQTFRKVSGKPAETISVPQQLPAERITEAMNSLNDGFESYDDFSLDFAPWTLIDVDGAETWGIEGVEFTNQYAPMSFIIFNPSATDPPMTSAAILPHEGSKLAACFASNGATNNDWLISPPRRQEPIPPFLSG